MPAVDDKGCGAQYTLATRPRLDFQSLLVLVARSRMLPACHDDFRVLISFVVSVWRHGGSNAWLYKRIAACSTNRAQRRIHGVGEGRNDVCWA